MKLNASQLATYQEQGFLLVPELFEDWELALMRAELPGLSDPAKAGVLYERNGLLRALHGCHQESSVFRGLTEHPRILEVAEQVLQNQVYIHQFKINIKAAFGGDVWPWHQDFIFWFKEDGMPAPEAINAALYLDDVHEFNGPLYFISGSHREGMIDVPPREKKPGEKSWTASFSADLKYRVPTDIVARLEAQKGLVSPKAAAGSVLFFHPNTIHASVPNLSPHHRRLVIITYNSVHNLPQSQAERRPGFLVGHDYRPLKANANPWK